MKQGVEYALSIPSGNHKFHVIAGRILKIHSLPFDELATDSEHPLESEHWRYSRRGLHIRPSVRTVVCASKERR